MNRNIDKLGPLMYWEQPTITSFIFRLSLFPFFLLSSSSLNCSNSPVFTELLNGELKWQFLKKCQQSPRSSLNLSHTNTL